MSSSSLTPEEYVRARRVLMRRDPVLGGAIVSQQLSTKAAATIFGRFVALFDDGHVPGAEAVAAVGDDRLRQVGLSGQKVGYLRDLCARISDGRLRLEELDRLSDEDVIERLTAVRGFGRWTAEMFLMFRLHRPDVLPVGDLGIIKAVQKLYGLRKIPDAKRIQKIGEAWRPYRSVASWYLWKTLRLDPVAGFSRNGKPKPRVVAKRSKS